MHPRCNARHASGKREECLVGQIGDVGTCQEARAEESGRIERRSRIRSHDRPLALDHLQGELLPGKGGELGAEFSWCHQRLQEEIKANDAGVADFSLARFAARPACMRFHINRSRTTRSCRNRRWT